MPGAVSDSKDPTKVRAGRAGALRRWGEPGTRTVDLRDLDASTRRLVAAMVDAAKAVAADTAGKK